jgi:hypothetical protein
MRPSGVRQQSRPARAGRFNINVLAFPRVNGRQQRVPLLFVGCVLGEPQVSKEAKVEIVDHTVFVDVGR